jgi:hypothetical protein
MSDKYIFDFNVSYPIEVEKETEVVDGDVKTLTKTKTVEDKTVKILVKKPTRRQREEADLEYSRFFFKMQDAGLLTKQQVAKKYNDKGGDLSKPEVDLYMELQGQLTTATLEAQRYLSRGESASEEDKKAGEKALTTITIVKRQIIDFETQRSEIFNHTADNKAFYRLLNWFTVFLSCKEEDGKTTELFSGADFEARLDDYETKVDAEDPVVLAAKDKLSAYIAYWFTSGAKTKEDFKPLEEELA